MLISLQGASAEVESAMSSEIKPEDLDFSVLGSDCIWIEGAHNRGISLKQLLRLRDFIQFYADEHGAMSWNDLTPPEHGNIGRLMLKSLNLYHLNDWVIKPATKRRKCSLVELMCDRSDSLVLCVALVGGACDGLHLGG